MRFWGLKIDPFSARRTSNYTIDFSQRPENRLVVFETHNYMMKIAKKSQKTGRRAHFVKIEIGTLLTDFYRISAVLRPCCLCNNLL